MGVITIYKQRTFRITGLTFLRVFLGVIGSLTTLAAGSGLVLALTIVFGVVVEFESDSFSFSSLS